MDTTQTFGPNVSMGILCRGISAAPSTLAHRRGLGRQWYCGSSRRVRWRPFVSSHQFLWGALHPSELGAEGIYAIYYVDCLRSRRPQHHVHPIFDSDCFCLRIILDRFSTRSSPVGSIGPPTKVFSVEYFLLFDDLSHAIHPISPYFPSMFLQYC